MKIKIETYSSCRYDAIKREYGSVLHKFGLTRANDGSAYVNINRLEELFEIDKALGSFCDERDDWQVYFGIIIKHYDGEPLLEIKDNYD